MCLCIFEFLIISDTQCPHINTHIGTHTHVHAHTAQIGNFVDVLQGAWKYAMQFIPAHIYPGSTAAVVNSFIAQYIIVLGCAT